MYDQTIDWDGSPTLLSDIFNSEISYDAMNRPAEIIQPDASVVAYAYNKAGLLETVQAKIRGITTYTEFVTNIDYNEKGQRTAIYYRNGSKTAYTYDDKSFRLTRLLTTRNTGQDILQDISYTYDAVGNLTETEDDAQQTFYYSNSVIEPKGKYWYDALYRLTKATGRELSSLAIPSNTDFANNISVPNTASNAMQNFTQEYRYDELGNIEQMRSVGDWTRDYYYETVNNRLKNHDNQTDVYAYDEHGNCIEMPHLAELIWDYKDELKEVDLGGGGTAYYVYDSSGERVRKVVDKGSVVEERLYIGGFEVYRKTISGTLDYERETLKITEGRNTIAQLETKTIENGNTISTPTTNQRFQYSNHLGSACLELDSNAAIISYEEYHPFGTSSYRSGSSETEVSLKRYKYVGKERDEETGLYYYGARYYAAWIARFVSVDPLQFEYPHYTPFQYAGNKPITFIDLDGLEPEKNPENPEVQDDRDPTSFIQWVFDKSGGMEEYNKNYSTIMSQGEYYSNDTSGYETDTKVEDAEDYNLYVKQGTYFEFNQSFDVSNEELINFMLGNMITGAGPENIVFPENSPISNEMLYSDIVVYSLLNWYEDNKDALNSKKPDELDSANFKPMSFGLIKAGADVMNNNLSIFGIPGFVGSAEVTITPNSEELQISIFNVTSITSGDFWKDLPWNEHSVSCVREENETTPFGNISQEYNLSVPINWDKPLNTISNYVIKH
ncbi:MAG: hypothetical protein K9H64_21730 [Bacteroidales bacterium]|nr:hypothetical protein [Bacteroidales bacterium]MCF8458638.1 hypothetical protein [Bacteroidales bacterium]